jgi:hypothetical protein
MSRPLTLVPLAALIVVIAGCPAPKKSDAALSDACDPIVPNHCGFPFPSGVYEEKDATKPSGRRVAFHKATDSADGTLPKLSGADTDPTPWMDSDGFSPGQAPMTVIEGATAAGLPGQNQGSLSLDAANSPTLLLEDPDESDLSKTPTLVPHFSEVDVNGEDTADNYDRALMIRPLVRLKDKTHYIVAIRNVKDATGAVIEPVAFFKDIRDGKDLHGRDNRYATIFAKLKKLNVDTSKLQIAWDYHTASKENNTSQLVDMRDRALAALPATGPQYSITYQSDNPDALTGRRIFGKIHVPLFLDSATMVPGADDLHTGYTLQRDADGRPKINGFADFDFIVNIPKSVFDDTASAPSLLQGHGLFSDRAEGQNANSDTYNFLLKFANENKYVTVTVDMLGWRTNETYNGWPADFTAAFPSQQDPNAEDDETKAQSFISAKLGSFRGLIDRGTQGMVNQLVAMKMMETSLANDPALKASDGHKFIDTTKSFYRGDSQGGILGVTFMALSQTVSRGFLGEPGLPYNLLLQRSKDFLPFVGLLKIGYGGNLNMQLVLGLMQMFWDRFEGDGFAPYITTDMLPNTPSHHVLLNSGIGDFQVTPIGSHILARAVGAKVLKPALHSPLYTTAAKNHESYPLFGLDEADGPIDGNALQEYDFGVLTTDGVTVFDTNVPPQGDNGFDPHNKIRVLQSSRTSTDVFLRTGKAENHCGADGSVAACVFPP